MNSSRREFLERMLAVGAASTAASSSLSAFADEPKPSKSANEKLGVATIGVHGRGGSHLSAYEGKTDTEIVAIIDIDQNVGLKATKATADKQGGREPKFYDDIRRALEDKRIDIITVATPNHWHSLAAIWAMQAGKDVYVEKPVSHNVSEGRRCVEVARKYKRICQTGTQSRSTPGMRAAMKFVHDGKLGTVKVARGLCYKRRKEIGPPGKYPVPGGVNYDLWLGPAPLLDYVPRKQFHYDWHWQWAYGNGDLGNQGIHQMDLCRWALGVDRLSNSVLSYGGRLGYEGPDAGETANTQVVIHNFGDKSLIFEVRGLETENYRKVGVGIIVEGSDADLVMWSYDSGAAYDKSGKEIAKFSGGGDGHHFSNFIQGVKSRKHETLNADILEGHLSSALCHLGNISYRLGGEVSTEEVLKRVDEHKTTDNAKDTLDRTAAHLKANGVDLAKTNLRLGEFLTLDPVREQFVGNAKADALLTREYRAPFVVPAADKI